MDEIFLNYMTISENLKKVLANNMFLSIVSGSVIIAFWIYINQMNENQMAAAIADQNVDTQTATQQITIPTPVVGQNVNTPPAIQKITRLGTYKDGVYKASSDIPWGTLTIGVTVKNGQWTSVKPIKIPASPPSIYAASYLAKQAMQAQNDLIDGVSGATYTSDAFRDDLKQIIAQSK